MWSDQSDDEMKFASRPDSTVDDTAFGSPEVAVSGNNMADDHINLKADASGRVYAATKTSASSDSQPFLLLNVRDAAGHWSTTVFGIKADSHTRPIILLDEPFTAIDTKTAADLFALVQRWHQERSTSLPIRLYASRAVFNGATQQIVFRAMIERVTAARYEGLQLRTEELETDHGGAIRPSFEHGLEMILGGGA